MWHLARVQSPPATVDPSKEALERSRNRLESLRTSNRKLIDTAARLVAEGRFDVGRFGFDQHQILNALDRPAAALETVGVTAVAMEAIVRRIGRPPLLVRNGRVELEPLDDFPPGTDALIRASEVFVPSAGRVEFVNHSMRWAGSGWVVDRQGDAHLVLTNRHVAQLVARRAPNGKGVFLRSPQHGARYGALIDFNEEVGARPQDARAAPVISIEYLADDFSADIALLKVRQDAGPGWTMPDPIRLAPDDAQDGERVALIGYPAFDSRNDLTDMERYFRDLYDVKRFAPGFVMRTGQNGILSHDCTSLGGNSGSVLLSLDQNAAVGLHFAGLYGVENSAVGVATIKDLLAGRLVSVDVKLRGEMAEAADGRHTAEELAGRSGYDPHFLDGFEVPWPKLPDEIRAGLAVPVDATRDRAHELRYTHFGVLYSAADKLPALTAVNIDGENAVRIKRGKDKWFFDERIDRALQHGQKAYADPQIDRGHMVRREDPNWGDDAETANDDTFHYTNAAPQHSDLNQGKKMWQGLENYILDSSRTHGFKACVFTAPVFGEDDPVLDEGIRVPLEFWKVVVMVDESHDRLHATAYLLSQGQMIRKLLEDRNRTEALEGFVLGPYRTFQISLKDLEDATGVDFGALKRADPLARSRSGREAIEQNVPVVMPLESVADLVL